MPIKIFVAMALLWLPCHALADQPTSDQPTADHPTADEQAVWAMEEAYWGYVESNDLAGYKTLWDDRFVGWPTTVAPIGKSEIGNWIPRLHADPDRVYKFERQRQAVRSFGDVVATHYVVRRYLVAAGTDTVLEEKFYKVTHTWQRRGDSWQIISGMSGAYPPAD